MSSKLLSRRVLSELGELQGRMQKLGEDRNAALRIVLTSRFAAIQSAQRDLWLEFAWADQEYRTAVWRLAQFCLKHRSAREARWSSP